LEENFPFRELLMLISFAFAIFVSLVIAFIPPAENTQENFNIESLFIALTSDGNALIEYDVRLQKAVVQRTNLELIGNTINDLSISDISDNPLPYRFIEETREAKINSSRVVNLLISYSTPDLVDKRDRIWTFSVNSPVPFSLKMPPESQVIKLGGNNSTSSVRRILQEDLLTFSQGYSQISYIIGPQGTYAEANVVIKSAELSIKEAINNYPGINLTDSQNILQQATVSKLNGRNLDAAKYAIEANNIVQSTISDFRSSQDSIMEAEIELDKLGRINTENEYYEYLLNEANMQFHNGQYDLARLSAEDLIIQLSQNGDNSPAEKVTTPAPNGGDRNNQPSITVYVLVGAIVILAVGIILLIRKKHYRKLSRILSTLPFLETFRTVRGHNNNNQMEDLPSSSSSLSAPHKHLFRSSSSSHSVASDQPEILSYRGNLNKPNLDSLSPPLSSPPSPPALSPISSPSSSSLPLSQPFASAASSPSQGSGRTAIKQILSERPHLRLEDEQLLNLLADKQGAAFESDIRNKLLLPKTSVWRLVRRLEREELIDVIKVDNQNLIKLKIKYNTS
jgi:uncharacterized membrane protein